MTLKLGSLLLAACAAVGTGANAAEQKPIEGAHPVLISISKDFGQLIGGLVNGKWNTPGKAAKHTKDNQSYAAYDSAKRVGEVTGAAAVKTGSKYNVKLTSSLEGFSIATDGDWNLFPRAAKSESTENPDYTKAVRAVLDEKKLTEAPVCISKVQSVDLLNDGKTAAIITAESKGYHTDMRSKGEYSMVLLLVNGSSELLKGEFHLTSRKESSPETYSVAGLWDVDGDNQIEIGVAASSPKKGTKGLSIFDWAKDKIKVLGKISNDKPATEKKSPKQAAKPEKTDSE